MDVWLAQAPPPFDVLQPDFGYCGGTTNAVAIADAARRHQRRFVPHSPQGDMHLVYALHVACALAPSDPAGSPAGSPSDAAGNPLGNPLGNLQVPAERLEVACVDDGLRQWTVDDATGELSSASLPFLPRPRLERGRVRLDTDAPGWGVRIDQVWLDAATARTFGAVAGAGRRSAL